MDLLEFLIGFVESWRSDNGITGSSPLTGDDLAQFAKNLQTTIASSVSFDGEGTLVLYSGVDYESIASYCSNSNGQYYMISQTEAGKVLWDEEFRRAVTEAIGDDATALKFLEGKVIEGTTPKRIGSIGVDGTDILSLDDFISQNIAKVGAESGDVVMVLGNKVKPNSVGVLTEIPEVLNQSTKITGDIASKLHVIDDISLLDNGLSNISKIDMSKTTVFFDKATGKVSAVDMSKIIGGEIPKAPTNSISVTFDDAVEILGKVGGNADDAIRVISAANNNVDDALRILTKTGNNVNKAVEILGKVDGNADEAIKAINDATGNIDDAIKILDAADDIAKADANTNIFKSIFKTISEHPEATARIASYGAIGISAIGMINDAIKDFDNGNDLEGYRKIARWAVTMEASTAAGWGGAAIGAAIGGPAGFVVGLILGVGFGWAADALSGLVFDGIWDMFNDAADAQPPRDPLAMDLGALGIDLTTLENGVNFDLDKNGFAEKTAWIGIEDGFLVLDRNKDGIINDGGELFGDQVELSNGLISVSGFEALADLDENADGMIDHNDSIWNDLCIWVDANHNGVSDSGELKTFDELGIVSISLDVTKELPVYYKQMTGVD